MREIPCPDCANGFKKIGPDEVAFCLTCNGDAWIDEVPYIEAEREADRQSRRDMSGFVWLVLLIPNFLIFY